MYVKECVGLPICLHLRCIDFMPDPVPCKLLIAPMACHHPYGPPDLRSPKTPSKQKKKKFQKPRKHRLSPKVNVRSPKVNVKYFKGIFEEFKVRTRSTTIRDRNLQFRGAVSTGGSPLDFCVFSPGFVCNLVRRAP